VYIEIEREKARAKSCLDSLVLYSLTRFRCYLREVWVSRSARRKGATLDRDGVDGMEL
jgi:hypothetical protein